MLAEAEHISMHVPRENMMALLYGFILVFSALVCLTDALAVALAIRVGNRACLRWLIPMALGCTLWFAGFLVLLVTHWRIRAAADAATLAILSGSAAVLYAVRNYAKHRHWMRFRKTRLSRVTKLTPPSRNPRREDQN